MKESFEEQIIKSGIFSSNIFALPQNKQNEHLKDTVIRHELLRPVINIKFPDAGGATATIYFPYSTKHLLKRYSKRTVHVLDMIYSMLLVRREVITLKVPDREYQKYVVEADIMPDALLCMFFNDYAILPQQMKNKLQTVNPLIYLQSELN